MRKLSIVLIAILISLCMTGVHAEEDYPVSPWEIGTIVAFGHYEQDGDEENGPEEIEWIVLDEKDGKSLLLSRYGLEAMPYHTKVMNITWAKCSLRTWLNKDFLESAFSEDEQDLILETKVDNSQKQGYRRWNNWKKTKGGKNTKDRIFLLSYLEAKQYLGVTRSDEGNPSGVARMTEFVRQKTADSPYYRNMTEDSPEYGVCTWWLRSPGYLQKLVATVNWDGTLVAFEPAEEAGGVRPALWVKKHTPKKRTEASCDFYKAWPRHGYNSWFLRRP